MATARPIRLGTPAPLGPAPSPASFGPASGRWACALSDWLVSAISRTADLVPLLAPVAVGFLVFA
jgi:hypothetical protein